MIVEVLVVGYAVFILGMTLIAYIRFFRDEPQKSKLQKSEERRSD